MGYESKTICIGKKCNCTKKISLKKNYIGFKEKLYSGKFIKLSMYLGKSNRMFLIQCFSIIFIVFHYKDYVVFLIYYLQLLPIKNVENPDIFSVYPINIYSDTDYNKSILVEFTCNSNIMLSWFYSDFFPTKIKLWWLEKKQLVE